MRRPYPSACLAASENGTLLCLLANNREEHDLAKEKPQVVNQLQARLATLMQGVFEAPMPPEGTQARVCEASVANGMWITPLYSLPPPPPPSPPSPPLPRHPLPGDEWLAFAHQWQVNATRRHITAIQNRAVLKKECASSETLPTGEVRFFNAGQVVTLSNFPQATAVCGAGEKYFQVEARLIVASGQ